MLKLGNYNTLRVTRFSDHGAYLDGGPLGEILMPKKYVPRSLRSGEDETRAWTIRLGTRAPQAAGKIHSDFERGFIRAEVVNYKDLLECGSLSAAKEKGLVGLEGKDYVVKDGDVILFRFNV